MIVYTVREGDTLFHIAAKYGVSAQELQDDNALPDPIHLTPGQAVVIVKGQAYHIVRAEDTLSGIAERYGISRRALWQRNPALLGEDHLIPGQRLKLRFPLPTGGSLRVSASAGVDVGREDLCRTLPYLSDLSLRGYCCTWDGRILAPKTRHELLLLAEYGVAAFLQLGAPDTGAAFDGESAARLLRDAAARCTLRQELCSMLACGCYAGVDVAFCDSSRQGLRACICLVRLLRRAMGERAGVVRVLLTPPQDGRAATFDGAYCRALGRVADAVFLADLDAAGKDGRHALRHFLGEACEEGGAYLSIPLPYGGCEEMRCSHTGQVQTRKISTPLALATARLHGAHLQYDDASLKTHFSYQTSGCEGWPCRHRVDFTDARGVCAVLNAVAEYRVGGVYLPDIAQCAAPLQTALCAEFCVAELEIGKPTKAVAAHPSHA